MAAEAVAGLRRPRRAAPAARRSAERFSLGAAAQRWSASAGAELGRSIRERASRANLAAAVFLALAGALHVWTGIEVDRLGYALSEARIIHQQLRRDLDVLRAEYAAATTPAALERAALERLGMAPPAPGQVVVLR